MRPRVLYAVFVNQQAPWQPPAGMPDIKLPTLDSFKDAPGVSPEAERDPLALVAVICAALALVMGTCAGVFFWLFALMTVPCALVSLRRIKAEPERYKGRPLAWISIALVVVGLVLGVLTVIVGLGANVFRGFFGA